MAYLPPSYVENEADKEQFILHRQFPRTNEIKTKGDNKMAILKFSTSYIRASSTHCPLFAVSRPSRRRGRV